MGAEALQQHAQAYELYLQEVTNFQLDVNPSGLKGALERFAQFFIAPLIKPDALEREVNAVDNEFSGLILAAPAVCPEAAHAWIWTRSIQSIIS